MSAETPVAPPKTGMSDNEFTRLLAPIERRKNSPGYFERWEAQVTEYRCQLQEGMKQRNRKELVKCP